MKTRFALVAFTFFGLSLTAWAHAPMETVAICEDVATVYDNVEGNQNNYVLVYHNDPETLIPLHLSFNPPSDISAYSSNGDVLTANLAGTGHLIKANAPAVTAKCLLLPIFPSGFSAGN